MFRHAGSGPGEGLRGGGAAVVHGDDVLGAQESLSDAAAHGPKAQDGDRERWLVGHRGFSLPARSVRRNGPVAKTVIPKRNPTRARRAGVDPHSGYAADMTQSTLQPYLAVRDAAAAIEVYTRVFGAREVYRLRMGDKLGHAELDIGSARLLISDEFPEMGVVGPLGQEGHSVSLLLYVEDVDATVTRALDEGFTQEGETKNEFFGDRAAKLRDPFGHRWMVHQKVETLALEEIVRRFEKMMGS